MILVASVRWFSLLLQWDDSRCFREMILVASSVRWFSLLLQWDDSRCFSEMILIASVRWFSLFQWDDSHCFGEMILVASVRWFSLLQWDDSRCLSEMILIASVRWFSLLRWDDSHLTEHVSNITVNLCCYTNRLGIRFIYAKQMLYPVPVLRSVRFGYGVTTRRNSVRQQNTSL
jgi:hypothetical protein